MNYTLVRSNRKTCAIHIRDNAVEVRAPLWMPKADIDRFVASKESWIAEKLAVSAALAEQRADFSLSYGGTVLYRGEDCPIIAKPGRYIGLSEDGFYMPSGLSSDSVKSACVQIYRLSAKAVLTEKAYSFAERMDVYPAAIKINGAKTRWGSCSTQKSINFSWRLMMAGDPVIDYVAVHELAHLKEMNHSPRFWAVVERVLPDYNERRKELKALQARLRTEDWD